LYLFDNKYYITKNFFLSKSIYSRVVHPFLFPRRPRSHVARNVNRGKGAPIPGVRAAPSSRASLVRKRGVGGAPPSYSRADPVYMSPQRADRGEGALPGVHGPGFLCPPCTQTGSGWRAPFLFPRGPHSRVTPARGPGGGGTSGCARPWVPVPPLHTNGGWVAHPLPIPTWTPFACHPSTRARGGAASRFVHSPRFALHLVRKAQTRVRAQTGKGAPLPIPAPPPICVSALCRNRGWGGLHVAPGLRVSFARGRGHKGRGALLLGLRVPHSRRHCAQEGRGGADSHSRVGP